MALRDHAKRSFQIAYKRCYLSPRLRNNTYGPERNVTKYVTDANMGNYSRSIDSNDFDIGFYEESNITIGFDNSDGLFMEGQGFFEGAIVDRSKIKIVAGYHDIEDPANPDRIEFETTFEGIINDEGTRIDAVNEDAIFTVLSYASIINTLRADPGAVTNGQPFQEAIWQLLNRAEITQLLTVDLGNINPKVNLVIEDSLWFSGKQLKQAINNLLLAANSVMKIRDNTIYVVGRSESLTVRFQFYGKGAESGQPSNVSNIQNYSNGLKRTITRAQVNGITRDANDELIDLYGSHLKQIDLGFIENQGTAEAIADDILAEFQYPKPELELTTDFIGNEIDILDLVTISNEGKVLDAEPALYDISAVYDESAYVRRQGGLTINQIEGWKVLGITHNFKTFETILKLRSIGNQPYDGNANYKSPIYEQAIYDVSVYTV